MVKPIEIAKDTFVVLEGESANETIVGLPRSGKSSWVGGTAEAGLGLYEGGTVSETLQAHAKGGLLPMQGLSPEGFTEEFEGEGTK